MLCYILEGRTKLCNNELDKLHTFSSKPSGYDDLNAEDITNTERDIEPRNHFSTTNYDDDTNITYVDEDETNLNYHPLKNEKPVKPLSNDDSMGKNKDYKVQWNNKSRYTEETKLLKTMLPLLAKYKSFNLLGEEGETASSQQSKSNQPKSMNNKGIPDGKSVNVLQATAVSSKQKKIGSDLSAESKITSSENDGMQQNLNVGVHKTTLHHTKLMDKDGSLEILNNETGTDRVVPKPKVIRSKAEAIGEIFKALGSNNKIVKDANGLYLISGKHVKIIHRTHGGQAEERNLGKNDKETGQPSKKIEGVKAFKTPGGLKGNVESNDAGLMEGKDIVAPVLQINSKDLVSNQQRLVGNTFNGIQNERLVNLSSFNLRDLEDKLGNGLKAQSNRTTNADRLIVKNNSGLNMDNRNEMLNQSRLSGSHPNIPVPNLNVNNTVSPIRENFTSKFTDDISKQTTFQGNKSQVSIYGTNESLPHEIGKASQHSIESYRYFDQEHGLSFGQQNLIQTTGDKNKSSTGLLSKHNQGKLLDKQNNLRSNTSNFTHKEGIEIPESFSDEMHGILPNRSSVSDGRLSDVQIEIVDEAKADSTVGMYRNSSEVKQDVESVEVIDEGRSNQTPLKITPQDVNQALQQRFGKVIEKGNSEDSWKEVNQPTRTAVASKEIPSGKLTTQGFKSSRLKTSPGKEGYDNIDFGSDWKQREVSTKAKGTSKSSKMGFPITPTEGKTSALGGTINEKNTGTAAKKKDSKTAATTGVFWKTGTKPETQKSAKFPALPEHTQSAMENESKGISLVEGKSLPRINKGTSVDESNSNMFMPIGKGNESPKIRRKESRMQNSGPTWSIDVLGTVGKAQGGSVDRAKVIEGHREYSPGRNGNIRESQNVPNVKGGHISTSDDKSGTPGTTKDYEVILSGNRASNRGTMSSQSDQRKSQQPNAPSSGEPMIPKRVVDALLSSLLSQGRNMNINDKTITQDDMFTKTSEHQNDNIMIQSVSDKIPLKTKQDVSSRATHIKTMSKNENSNLDHLLVKFVNLLTRHMKPKISRDKTKLSSAPRRKHQVSSTSPLLSYQEKLLWHEQRKLEQQLAAEQKLLEKSKLNDNLKSKTSPTNVEIKLKSKIQALNKERNYWVKKLKTLRLQEKYKWLKHDKYEPETVLTEVYGTSNQETKTAPYIGSRPTYSITNDDKEYDGSLSELKHADAQLKQLLAEYETMIGSSNGENADVSEENSRDPGVSEGHPSALSGRHMWQVPEPRREFDEYTINSKENEMDGSDKSYNEPELSNLKVHKETFRNPDKIPGNIADQIQKSFTAPETNDGQNRRLHISAKDPIYQYTRSYNDMHRHETQNVPSYPTPSFLNKEADFASDTAERLGDPFKSSKFQNQRSVTNGKTEYHADESPEQSGQGAQRGKNVFPGSYSYSEGHDSTPSWREENENLLQEMPEYSAKANTIESESQPEHYSVITSEKEERPQVKNLAGFRGVEQPGVLNVAGSLGTENSRSPQSRENQQEGNPKMYSETPKIVDSETTDGTEFRSGNEGMASANAFESTAINVYPQRSDNTGTTSVIGKEPGTELRDAVSQQRATLWHENSEKQENSANEVGGTQSTVKSVQYNSFASTSDSDGSSPQVTSTEGSENDDMEDSRRPMGTEIDGAFDVVHQGEVPTLQRDTDNPEDGVQDKTYINGDEYHLQKKHDIMKKNRKNSRRQTRRKKNSGIKK